MLLEPYKVFSFKTLVRKIDTDNDILTNILFEDMYSDNPDLIKFIYDYLYLNVLFVTPKFKLDSGYEYINIINNLEKEFGDDIIIYECDENTKSTIIYKSIKSLSFSSLIINLSITPEVNNTNIVKTIDDLYVEDKVINTIIYFLNTYGNKKLECVNIYENDISYAELNNYDYNDLSWFINILNSIIKDYNFNIDINNINNYMIDNNIKLENILQINKNTDNVEIITNTFRLIINGDGYVFTIL